MTFCGADPDLFEVAGTLFSKFSTGENTGNAEVLSRPRVLWQTISEMGLHLVGIDDDKGGSGGSTGDALAVHYLVGMHAVPLPLCEHYLGAWLCAMAGIVLPAGVVTVAPPGVNPRRSGGRLRAVPWASQSKYVVASVTDSPAQATVLVLETAACRVDTGTDLAGVPMSAVRFSADAVMATAHVPDPELLRRRGALVRAAQMAGAIEKAMLLTQSHTTNRHQFGRPLADFQGVQAHLVALAEASVSSSLAVARAVPTADTSSSVVGYAAKLIANYGARDTVRAAHQAHGALGMTREYPLHLVTRRLQAWRGEFGTEAELEAAIGSSAVRREDPGTGLATLH